MEHNEDSPQKDFGEEESIENGDNRSELYPSLESSPVQHQSIFTLDLNHPSDEHDLSTKQDEQHTSGNFITKMIEKWASNWFSNYESPVNHKRLIITSEKTFTCSVSKSLESCLHPVIHSMDGSLSKSKRVRTLNTSLKTLMRVTSAYDSICCTNYTLERRTMINSLKMFSDFFPHSMLGYYTPMINVLVIFLS
jgi:hypothetical protein